MTWLERAIDVVMRVISLGVFAILIAVPPVIYGEALGIKVVSRVGFAIGVGGLVIAGAGVWALLMLLMFVQDVAPSGPLPPPSRNRQAP